MSGKEISELFSTASRRAAHDTLTGGGTITIKHGRKIVKKTSSGIISEKSSKSVAYRKVKKRSYDIES
jgi:hypothetical protein